METPDRPARRLVLRAVLKELSPIVARVISVPDSLKIQPFHELFLAMLHWRADPDFILRVHGQAFASFRRRYRDTRLDDFRLRAQGKFVYVCDRLDLWEWEVRVLDTEPLSADADPAPRCLNGCGAAPPERCGGPVGYRLILRRQAAGPAIADPSTAAATVGLPAVSFGDELTGLDLATLEETLTPGWKSAETRRERTGELEPTRFSVKETNERLGQWWQCPGGAATEFRIAVSCVDEDGTGHRRDLLALRRTGLDMASLGMTLAERKALQRDLPGYLVEQQAAAWLAHQRSCPHCARRHVGKASGHRVVSTVYGRFSAPSPRWYRCSCRPGNDKTFRPTAQWLTERTTPEMLYVETKWASLIPFAKVVDLLRDVLPVSTTLNAQSVQNHLHASAERLEEALGEESERLFEGTEESLAAEPLPDGPMTVGIDGGMLRGRNKSGFFEAHAGKSVVAFRRDEAEDVPSARRFAFVQTYDQKPRRRLWDLMKSQGDDVAHGMRTCPCPTAPTRCATSRPTCTPRASTCSTTSTSRCV